MASPRWLLPLLLIAAVTLGHWSGLLDHHLGRFRDLERLHNATSGSAGAIASAPSVQRPAETDGHAAAAPEQPLHKAPVEHASAPAAQQAGPAAGAPGSGSFKQHLPIVLPFKGLSSAVAPQAGPTPAAADAGVVPGDFDAALYLAYNPDVASSFQKTGAASDSAALQQHARMHYLLHGRAEQRLYQRVPVAVRYTACGGLMNQHYSHLAAVTIAGALGADLLIPQALVRDSFASYFNTNPARNKLAWRHVPFGTLWDTGSIVRYFAGQGLDVSIALEGQLPDNISTPAAAYQKYPVPGVLVSVKATNIYLAAEELPKLVINLTAGILAAASAAKGGDGRQQLPAVLLDLPCTLFSVRTSQLPLARAAALHFSFSPQVQRLADLVIERISADLGAAEVNRTSGFNGLHLRMEADAADWATLLGGKGQLLGLFLQQMRKAGFDSSTPLFVASGLLTYQGGALWQEAQRMLAPYAQRLLHKELYLTKRELDGLHLEQQALLDFLVLVRCRAFVGIGTSTFSVFLREYRHVTGLAPRGSAHLVSGAKIGTDGLFAASAVLL